MSQAAHRGPAPVEQFDWPSAAAIQCAPDCSDLAPFVTWLIEIGEVEGLSPRRLWALSQEWLALSGFALLSPDALLRRLPRYGLLRSRPMVNGKRLTLYRIYEVPPSRHRARRHVKAA